MDEKTEIWETALEAATSELDGVRKQYLELTERMSKLNRTVRALQALLGRETESDPLQTGRTMRMQDMEMQRRLREQRVRETSRIHNVVDEDVIRVLKSHDSGTVREAPALLLTLEEPASAITAAEPKRIRRISETSSTARVAEIVAGANQPLTLSDLFEAFKARDWVEEDWETPEAAVNAAARRAVSRELIVRLPDKRYAPIGYTTSSDGASEINGVRGVEATRG